MFKENTSYPFPTNEQIIDLSRKSGLVVPQISSFMDNARAQLWKNSSVLQREDLEDVEPMISPQHSSAQPFASPSNADMSMHSFNIDSQNQGLSVNQSLSIQTNNGMIVLPNPSTVICRGNLPKKAVDELRKWLFEHFNHPYPSDAEKDLLAKQTSTNIVKFILIS
jgi:hypothetical protein